MSLADHFIEPVFIAMQQAIFDQREPSTHYASPCDIGRKDDIDKPMMSLIPPVAELEVAKVLTFGAKKYATDNWRHVPNAKQRYLDAALRHINAYRSGFELDAETQLSHLAHATCCLLFLLELDQGLGDA